MTRRRRTRPNTKRTARRLADSDIERLVDRSLAGEGALDRLVNVALFGPGYSPHSTWSSEWPDHAWASWGRAMRLEGRRRRMAELEEDSPAHRIETRGPTLSATWDAIEHFHGNGGPWWRIPEVTYPDLAPLLGIGSRSVNYYLVQVHGWRFAGRRTSRRITAAPCVACGVATPPEEIRDRLCPACVDQTDAAAAG